MELVGDLGGGVLIIRGDGGILEELNLSCRLIFICLDAFLLLWISE